MQLWSRLRGYASKQECFKAFCLKVMSLIIAISFSSYVSVFEELFLVEKISRDQWGV